MSITFTPSPVHLGDMMTATVRYTRPVPPIPTDLHIDAQHDDGSWHAITGYETIPAGMNPVAGIDIRISTGNPNVGGAGRRKFRVRWTLNGEEIDDATDETTLSIRPPMGPARRKCLGLLPAGWDCNQVLKAIGDALRKRD